MDKSPARHKHSDIRPTQNMEGATGNNKTCTDCGQDKTVIEFSARQWTKKLPCLPRVTTDNGHTWKDALAIPEYYFSETILPTRCHVCNQRKPREAFLKKTEWAYQTSLCKKCNLRTYNEQKETDRIRKYMHDIYVNIYEPL